MAESQETTGKVYLFNTTNLRIRVFLNDNALPPLAPAGNANESYAPSTMTVPRSDTTSVGDPVFATTNTMRVKFSGSSNTYISVNVDPDQYPTNQDLLLYIFYDYMVLVGTTNMIIINQAPS